MRPATVPGQEVLERSAVLVDEESVEVRFLVQLPAAGRRVLGSGGGGYPSQTSTDGSAASLLFDNVDGMR